MANQLIAGTFTALRTSMLLRITEEEDPAAWMSGARYVCLRNRITIFELPQQQQDTLPGEIPLYTYVLQPLYR